MIDANNALIATQSSLKTARNQPVPNEEFPLMNDYHQYIQKKQEE